MPLIAYMAAKMALSCTVSVRCKVWERRNHSRLTYRADTAFEDVVEPLLQEKEESVAIADRPTVAKYLAAQIEVSGKTQAQIAREVGYGPNVVNMIKQGVIRLPMNKVGQVAGALGIDPLHLLRMALREYVPDTWAAIDEVVGRALVTDNERRVLEVLRKAAGGKDVQLNRDEERAIAQIVREAAKRVA